jgi:hypothetical protein
MPVRNNTVRLRAGFDVVGKREVPTLSRKRTPVVQQVARDFAH